MCPVFYCINNSVSSNFEINCNVYTFYPDILLNPRSQPMNRKTTIIAVVVLLAVLAGTWMISRNKGKKSDVITIKPQSGTFEVSITTSGELRAKNSTKIMGPMNIRKAGVNQIKIADLIPEGTVVQKGDYVAQLDKTDFFTKLQEIEINVQKFRSQLKTEMLDSTLVLSQAREEIINLNYAEEEKRIAQEQSKYEPPAIQRQAEIDFEKAQRQLKQAQKNYETKVAQSTTKVAIAQSDLSKEVNKYDQMNDLIQNLTVIAPEKGMVIYAREWDGSKKIVGSMIRTWEPVIAELPDLTIMETMTYINEVDIQKIKLKQEVEIGLDADPDKKLIGTVENVANIGEQRPNSDSKVFQVVITVQTKDSTLRPAMTTSNKILISEEKNAFFVPLECIHSEDSTTFVYKKSGLSTVKQKVTLGMMNESEVVIKTGISGEDELFLSIPENAEELSWSKLSEK